MSLFGDLFGEDFRPRVNQNPTFKGLDVHMLGEGDLVTVSRDKRTGDRSYIHTVWKVMIVTPGHVLVEWSGFGEKPFSDDPKLFLIGEREFYDGREIVAALEKHKALARGEQP